MKIVIKNDSVQNSINYFSKLAETSGKGDIILKELEKEIENNIAYEFSGANPNNWEPLTEAYQAYKSAQGGGDVIGVFTGELKRSATVNAVKDITSSGFKWEIADTQSLYFTLRRPVGKYTIEWLKNKTKEIAQIILNRVEKE